MSATHQQEPRWLFVDGCAVSSEEPSLFDYELPDGSLDYSAWEEAHILWFETSYRLGLVSKDRAIFPEDY